MNVAASPHWLPLHVQRPGLYAGFWRRVLAWWVDALILAALHAVLVALSGAWLVVPWAWLGGFQAYPVAHTLEVGLQPFNILLGWLYFALCEASRWQATPGKLALNLGVTDVEGRRIDFGRATGRYFGKFVSALILGIGFLLAGWTARKQALHDLMASCCVVRTHDLSAWQAQGPEDAPVAAVSTGIPGWGVALIVLAVCVFVLVPVAGVLVGVAVPAYRDYDVRTEVAQGMEATVRARSLIAEYIGQRGALPSDNRALGLPHPEAISARYVSSVRVAGGKVVITYGNHADTRIRGGHVVMAPIGNAAVLRWQCSSPDIRDRYLPAGCRE
jgi:uncharacterized RDD family membrane protein YckC/Tfp pilus assembly protein PilE